MKTVCCWCGKVMGEHKLAGKDDLISHGICAECEQLVTANAEARRQERLTVPAHHPRQVNGAAS